MSRGGRELAETPGPGPVPHLQVGEWQDAYGLTAGITTRDREFDLGLFGPGRAASVLAHWSEFHQSFGSRFPDVVVSRQVHGTAIQFYETSPGGWQVTEGFDGHSTSTPGLLLAITVADCVPVYLAHPSSGAVCLLHAGWRGTAAGILEAGVSRMEELAGVAPDDIVMHCGVSICGSCYEVGPEVVRALTGRQSEGPETVDLRGELASRADRVGIRDITVSPWCSAHDADRFFSHRRSGGTDGRMVAFLGLPGS
ncbi:MAG: laccase domain-containing protein [Gemmatimonadetes bacterium]|nr:laccase domain-containing protein [Gemmatimonadota bacterium]